MLANNSGIYGKELSNPEVDTQEHLNRFVSQILDAVDLRSICTNFLCQIMYTSLRLLASKDPKKSTAPGDLILEVKVVYATGLEGKDLFLAMVNSVNFVKEFNTESDLTVFKDYIRKMKGKSDYRLYTEFEGKATHLASSISLKHFDSALRKRVLKTVS